MSKATGPRIVVLDHGGGNLVSIAQGLARAGADVDVSDSPASFASADGVVLPGVGATASVMAGIREAGFETHLKELRVPLLGICVGMQVLFESSEEDGAECLDLIGGVVRPLVGAPRLPHIGWNSLDLAGNDTLFAGLSEDPLVYFVHSFAPVPVDPGVVTAHTSYDDPFSAAVRFGNITGTQFHPERSGAAGLQILANFVAECGGSPMVESRPGAITRASR